ncbi:hypothetical protein EG329_013890 [Mollisiaceae sp. DMI_Dod_QoI]|nr:hypothetical protein EG329_013890 [Helotiales sp. DMI_Dod_QoI]
MVSAWNEFRDQIPELLDIETALRESYDRLREVMRASDEEIEACIALNELGGKRKREADATNTETDLESSPPTKILRTEMDPSPRQCPGAPRLTPRELSQPECMKTRDHSAASADDISGSPRQRVTKESLQTVRDKLSSLTFRNKEIKDSIQSLRQTVIDDLFSHMKVRQIAIGQLGRDDLDEDMLQLCTKALWSRRDEIYTKQKELTTLEELLGGHRAVLDFADSAYEELEQNIKLLETALTPEQCAALSAYDFPHMSALARLTGGIKLEYSSFKVPDPPISRRTTQLFPQFAKLPPEVRVLIWQEALPGPRIITHNSKHNRHLSILAVNKESRAAILTRLTRMLSPTFDADRTDTKIIYVNLDTDTIIRDLANPGGPDTFDLDTTSFNQTCYRLFIGLAKVKHLALAFDVLHNNGGQLFGPLQSCCPDLESLIIFPTSMVEGSPHKLPKQSTSHTLKFIDIDSNVIDYICFRWDQLRDRNLKPKALRGIAVLLTLYDHAQQYYAVFPEYVKQYGRSWTPKIRVCLMTKWNEKCAAWQTRYLEGDKYSKGFKGPDNRLYRGFVESGMICGEDGEVLSRYDGMARMFEGLAL